jgi:hypothetical protein
MGSLPSGEVDIRDGYKCVIESIIHGRGETRLKIRRDREDQLATVYDHGCNSDASREKLRWNGVKEQGNATDDKNGGEMELSREGEAISQSPEGCAGLLRL